MTAPLAPLVLGIETSCDETAAAVVGTRRLYWDGGMPLLGMEVYI